MINLKTDCEHCIHKSVCRNVDRPSEMVKQLEGSTFGIDSNAFNIVIDVICKDCKEEKIFR